MLIERLKDIVGPNGWITDAEALEPHLHEWRRTVVGAAAILVSPSSAEEVSAVVRACGAAGVGIVPQGGNTGMCAGAIPDESGTQVILSLSRMNRIRAVDADNYSMEVEAGCILANVQDAARNAKRYFPLSLGAEGSCQIGGNLATNAGGINVVRYGTARAQVLGVEAVLADGTIVDSLRALRKDTAGYDLKQLFIGSEGTLGIITAATLALHPLPGKTTTALVSISSSGAAVHLLAYLRAVLPGGVQAFELISDFVFGLVEKHIPGAALPLSDSAPWYVLLEAATGGLEEQLENALLGAVDAELISDAVIAKNSAEEERLWRLRHSISEAERSEGGALKHDISVPISRMEEFLLRGDQLLASLVPDAQLVAFGHVGDGNLHYNVMLGEADGLGAAVTAAVYELVNELGGSFSAEHGVGRVKREYLAKYRSDAEVRLMKALKQALDPQNTLNPGKVI